MNKPAAENDEAQAAHFIRPSVAIFVFLSLLDLVLLQSGIRYIDELYPYPAPPEPDFYLYLVPAVIAQLLFAARQLYAGRWAGIPGAFAALLAFPFFLFAQALFVIFTGDLWKTSGLAPLNQQGQVIVATLGACLWIWAVILAQARLAPGHTTEQLKERVQRTFGFLNVLLSLLLLAMWTSPTGEGYSIRARVSELILAASSAKTGLSEGMETFGTWDAKWTSSITISATGMVASATVSTLGVIVVYGTQHASGAVVTMIPHTTTDNKLVWSCIGHPAKYMPVSCRQRS